jgi:hypothetical protein
MTNPAVQPQDQHANFEKARQLPESEGICGDRRRDGRAPLFTGLSGIWRIL